MGKTVNPCRGAGQQAKVGPNGIGYQCPVCGLLTIPYRHGSIRRHGVLEGRAGQQSGVGHLAEALRGIRERFAHRRAPSVGTCAACGHQQDMMPSNQPMASSMAEAQWRCQACGGQIQVTFTMHTWTAPSPDDDIETLLELVAGLRADPAPPQVQEKKDVQASPGDGL